MHQPSTYTAALASLTHRSFLRYGVSDAGRSVEMT